MPNVIEGGYLRDILAQPQALEDTLRGLELSPALRDAAARLEASNYERVVLTGMGGSFWALYPLTLQLQQQGFTAVLLETAELIHFTPRVLGGRTLLIVVSQSGRSVETLRLLDMRPAGCFTIAVTNTPDSPLAQRSEAVVLTHAGVEFTVSCKTYVATLLALEWLGSVLLGRGGTALEEAAPVTHAYLDDWRHHVSQAQTELAGAQNLFYLGRGSSIASAGTGALITKESAHFHAEGMSAAAFRHGPWEMTGPGVYALLFAGDAATAPLNRKLADDIRQAGGWSALVGEHDEDDLFSLPHAGASIRPILEILPVQMITLALAAMCGREAGKFERATKITTIE